MEDQRGCAEWEEDEWTEKTEEDIDRETKRFFAKLPQLRGMVYPASILVGDYFLLVHWDEIKE